MLIITNYPCQAQTHTESWDLIIEKPEAKGEKKWRGADINTFFFLQKTEIN